jgi:hypothetical protein
MNDPTGTCWLFSSDGDFGIRSQMRGGIGFFVEDGVARFENIHAWTLEPMSHPFPEPWLKR